MYCGSGHKNDLIVVVVVVVISLLSSNFTVLDSFEGKLIGLNLTDLFYKRVKIFLSPEKSDSWWKNNYLQLKIE